jgi:hypothetical protein
MRVRRDELQQAIVKVFAEERLLSQLADLNHDSRFHDLRAFHGVPPFG